MRMRNIEGWIPVIALCGWLGLTEVAPGGWRWEDAGPYSYTNTANWSGGVIDHTWPATLTFTNNQTVTFESDYTVRQALDLYHSHGSYKWLRFVGSGGARVLTLSGDLTVELLPVATANALFGIGDTTAAEKVNVVLDGDRTIRNENGMAILNDLSGSGTWTKRGSGYLQLQGSMSFGGALRIEDGYLYLVGAGALTNVASIAIGGSRDRVYLRMDQRRWPFFEGNYANVTNRIADTATITAVDSTEIRLMGHDTAASTETIGTLVLDPGTQRLGAQLRSAVGDPAVTLTIDSLTRHAGCRLLLGGGLLSTDWYVLGQGSGVGYTRILAGQINGGAPSAALVDGILPWAYLCSHISNPQAFATYDTDGLRVYGYDETGALDDRGGTESYVTTLASAGASDNVLLSASEMISGTVTVNSLTLQSGISVTNTVKGNATLVIASGAILARGYSQKNNVLIDFGGREGFIYTGNQGVYNAGLHNDGGNGVTLGASSTAGGQGLILEGASTYTGPTFIINGAVEPRSQNTFPSNSAVRVAGGGVLYLRDGAEHISGPTWGAGAVRKTVIGSLSGPGRVGGLCNGGVYCYLVAGGNNDSTTFAGTIQRPDYSLGTLALEKRGSGTMTLGGANTYLGNTIVSEGGLYIDGLLASTNVTTVSGATLGGAGAITSDVAMVSIATGATLAPGATNAVGTLTVENDLTFAADAIYALDVSGTNTDTVVVNGTLDIPSTATVNVTIFGAGGLPARVVLFSAATLNAPGSVLGWTINGSRYHAAVDGTEVVLLPPAGTVISVR